MVRTVVHWLPPEPRDRRLDRPASVVLIAAVSTLAVCEAAYAFARGFSPLLLTLVLTAPGIGLQIGSQITNVARGILGL